MSVSEALDVEVVSCEDQKDERKLMVEEFERKLYYTHIHKTTIGRELTSKDRKHGSGQNYWYCTTALRNRIRNNCIYKLHAVQYVLHINSTIVVHINCTIVILILMMHACIQT